MNNIARINDVAPEDSYALRESNPPGRVILSKNGETIFSHREYRGAADHALTIVGLSAAVVSSMYADYRADAEERDVL